VLALAIQIHNLTYINYMNSKTFAYVLRTKRLLLMRKEWSISRDEPFRARNVGGKVRDKVQATLHIRSLAKFRWAWPHKGGH
jgi:hypothetical protein